VQAVNNAARWSSKGKYVDTGENCRLGRFEESASESARVIQIGGPDALNLCNLAIAHLRHRDAKGARK